jgi:hypothetical protein
MEGGALADDVASGAPNHDMESAQLPLARMGFKHRAPQPVLSSLALRVPLRP